MRTKLLTASMATALLLAATAANAVTYDFTGFASASSNASNTYSSSGVSITVTADSNVIGAVNPQVKENTSPATTTVDPGFYRGVGVVTDSALNGMVNASERLDIVIPAGYQVSSITVAGDLGFAFTMLMDNIGVGGATIATQNNVTQDARVTLSPSALLGSTFSIFGDASNQSGGVWLTGLQLSATVPLPAGGMLLAGALAAGGIATKRRKR